MTRFRQIIGACLVVPTVLVFLVFAGLDLLRFLGFLDPQIRTDIYTDRRILVLAVFILVLGCVLLKDVEPDDWRD